MNALKLIEEQDMTPNWFQYKWLECTQDGALKNKTS